MKQFVALFALVACSIAHAEVTSYAFSEVAPVMSYMKHYPSFYKAFPYMADSSYAVTPYMSKMVTPYYDASPFMSKMITPYMSAFDTKMVTPYVSSVATPYMTKMVTPVAPVKTQYHTQDMMGQAVYGHAELGQVHSAVQDAAGNKVGSFSHVLPDGSIAKTDYVADAMGYRVASNALPIHSVSPVSDTVEVMAAKAAHFAEVEKAKMRSKRDIAYTTAAHYPYSHYTAPITSYSYPHVANYAHSAYSTPYIYGSHLNYHY